MRALSKEFVANLKNLEASSTPFLTALKMITPSCLRFAMDTSIFTIAEAISLRLPSKERDLITHEFNVNYNNTGQIDS